MTQEMARKLIDGIDFYDKFQLWGEFPDRYDPYTVYELAETVAELRYEYAVQVKCDGGWVMEEDSYWGPYSVAVVRFGRTEEPARIVRRLAGEPEVVDE